MSKDINDVFNDFLLGMLSSSNATLILELRREWKKYMNAPVIELEKDNCVFDTKRIYDRMKELQEQEDARKGLKGGCADERNNQQPIIYKEKTYKLLKDFPNISTGMTLMWLKKFNGYTPSCTKNGKQIIIPAEIVENNSDWFLENE